MIVPAPLLLENAWQMSILLIQSVMHLSKYAINSFIHETYYEALKRTTLCACDINYISYLALFPW